MRQPRGDDDCRPARAGGFAVTTHAFNISVGRHGAGAEIWSYLDGSRHLRYGCTLGRGNGVSPSGAATMECRPTSRRQFGLATRSYAIASADRRRARRGALSRRPPRTSPTPASPVNKTPTCGSTGADEVINHVMRCWASLYTDRAIAYRHEQGYASQHVAMAVAVQQMVLPRRPAWPSPSTRPTAIASKVVIDSAFGLGETVVSGVGHARQLRGRQGRVRDRQAHRSRPRRWSACVADGDRSSTALLGRAVDRAEHHRRRGQGGCPLGPPGREALRPTAGHRMGRRRRAPSICSSRGPRPCGATSPARASDRRSVGRQRNREHAAQPGQGAKVQVATPMGEPGSGWSPPRLTHLIQNTHHQSGEMT